MPDPPIPIVPVLLNALYPPNQPTPSRCLEIGEAIADAVAGFPGDARVGVVASGGLKAEPTRNGAQVVTSTTTYG